MGARRYTASAGVASNSSAPVIVRKDLKELMAYHKSAKTRIRRNERAAVVNRSRRTRIRGVLRLVNEAIGSGDQKAALAALVVAQPEVARGAKRGVLHRKTASRKISRLAMQIKSMKG